MAECFERSSEGSIVLRNKCRAGRGFALSLLGDHNAATAAFKKVVGSDPTFFERHPDMATQYLLSLREAGQQEEP